MIFYLILFAFSGFERMSISDRCGLEWIYCYWSKYVFVVNYVLLQQIFIYALRFLLAWYPSN